MLRHGWLCACSHLPQIPARSATRSAVTAARQPATAISHQFYTGTQHVQSCVQFGVGPKMLTSRLSRVIGWWHIAWLCAPWSVIA